MRQIALAAFLPLLPLFFLGGCATGASAGKASTKKANTFRYETPHQPAIGRIVSVNRARQTAVVALNPDSSNLLTDGQAFLAENGQLAPTARLQGSAQRFGSSFGVHILEGLPSAGEWVVLQTPAAGKP